MPVIKNKSADLKSKYRIYLKIALILSLALIIAAFKFSPYNGEKEKFIDPKQDLITVEDVINTVQKFDKPKPPERPVIIPTTNEEPEDVILPDISIDQDIVLDKPPDLPGKHKIIEDEPFIDIFDEWPEPVGGLKALQERVVYTEIAKKVGIEGKVIIEAWIDKEGNVVNARIFRDIGGGLGESALNAVLLTKFTPGKQRGIPVKVKVKIPVRFALK
jgi:protein TonB